ncbi:MAG TPA: SDR family NAD(P)-dependent oxidoreductase [Gemmataceae bacterium]|nr:SDR family NAD(P)-dependent oxidoreductase [Gemmataceae bacterium]
MSNAPRKVALVTGAATGIGRACATRCARMGLGVAVNYSRSEPEAQETLDEVKRHGVPATLCKCSVADDAGVRAMVARCREELGGLDVLVCNAGTTHFIDAADLEALTDAVWDDIFAVNVKGTFSCCRAALSLLKERKGGIVNVTSVAGLQGQGSSIPYRGEQGGVELPHQVAGAGLRPGGARQRRRLPGPRHQPDDRPGGGS